MSKQNAQARAAAAAKIAAEAKRRERRNTLLKIAAVVAAMAVIVVVGLIAGTHKSGGSDNKASQSAPAAGDSKYSLTVGDKSAPHKVIVYEDFLCPYCDQFELASSAQLAQLAAQGKVYLDYRPFHFLPEDYSLQALNAFAAVLKTSGPDVAKKFHDLLYQNQPSEEGPFPAMSKLVDLAVQAGADESKVKAAIEDTSSQKSWTDGADKIASDEAKIQGTPTVLLDGHEFQQGSTVQELATNLVKAVS